MYLTSISGGHSYPCFGICKRILLISGSQIFLQPEMEANKHALNVMKIAITCLKIGNYFITYEKYVKLLHFLNAFLTKFIAEQTENSDIICENRHRRNTIKINAELAIYLIYECQSKYAMKVCKVRIILPCI